MYSYEGGRGRLTQKQTGEDGGKTEQRTLNVLIDEQLNDVPKAKDC
jgi:hypothetical protein